MKPYKITLYVYAETHKEAEDAEKALYDFVKGKYERGVLVRADKITEALRRFADNFFLTNFLKNGR